MFTFTLDAELLESVSWPLISVKNGSPPPTVACEEPVVLGVDVIFSGLCFVHPGCCGPLADATVDDALLVFALVSLFELGKFAGGGTRRPTPILPNVCSPCLTGSDDEVGRKERGWLDRFLARYQNKAKDQITYQLS